MVTPVNYKSIGNLRQLLLSYENYLFGHYTSIMEFQLLIIVIKATYLVHNLFYKAIVIKCLNICILFSFGFLFFELIPYGHVFRKYLYRQIEINNFLENQKRNLKHLKILFEQMCVDVDCYFGKDACIPRNPEYQFYSKALRESLAKEQKYQKYKGKRPTLD